MVSLDNLRDKALCIPDFDPVFKKKKNSGKHAGPQIISMLQPMDPGHEHIIIRPRREWSSVFKALSAGKLYGRKRLPIKIKLIET